MGPDDLLNKALVARNGLVEQRAEVLGVIVNQGGPDRRKQTCCLAMMGHRQCSLRVRPPSAQGWGGVSRSTQWYHSHTEDSSRVHPAASVTPWRTTGMAGARPGVHATQPNQLSRPAHAGCSRSAVLSWVWSHLLPM